MGQEFDGASDQGPLRFAQSYEAVFSVFLAALAFLWRDNAHMAYPQILYLFICLLLLNLGAGATLRLWPQQRWLSALIILGNCAVITACLRYSGGPQSNLWVLYLLPVTTASLFLTGREVVWVTLGAVGSNALHHYAFDSAWGDAATFLVALKSGVFVFAGATTFRIAQSARQRASLLRAKEAALRELESESRERQRRLERAEPLAEVGMASSGVAHDLKNPLLVVLGTAETLLAQEDFPERFRPDLERIRRASRLCREISSGVLGLADKRRSAQVRCGVDSLIGSALDLLADTLNRSRVEVRTEYEDGLPPVEACPFELQRVFMNLIANARDAMPGGGALTVRTRFAGPDFPGGHAHVRTEVEDTGTGIAPDMLKRLFTPFSTSKAPGKGTGLGLYLCREIAFRHGGWLGAENLPVKGARFVLSLPVAVGENPLGRTPAAAGDGSRAGAQRLSRAEAAS